MTAPPRHRPLPVPIRRDRGAVIPLVAVCLVLLVITAALAIDIGRLSVSGRETRNVADIAAIDSVKFLNPDVPANVQQVAIEVKVRESAARNGFVEGRDGTLKTTLGTYDRATKAFDVAPLVPPNAVRVQAIHPNDNLLVPGSFTVSRTATAMVGGNSSAMAGIGIATTTAAVDTGRSAVLNAILGNALGTHIALDAVSWGTLLGADVNLLELAEVGLGLPPAEVDRLLNNVWSMADLIDALAVTVVNGPAAVVLGSLVSLGAVPLGVRLADFIEAGLTNPGAQLLNLSVGQLLEAAAMASGKMAGKDTIGLDLGVGIPGLAGAAVSLRIVHPPEFKYGGVGTTVRSAQTVLNVDAALGVQLLGVGVHLPIAIDTGRGRAEILAIACSGGSSVQRVDVRGSAVTASVNVGKINADGALVPASVLTLPLGSYITARTSAGVATGSADLSFLPLYQWDNDPKRVSATATPSGVLQTSSADLDVVVIGLDLGVGALLRGVLGGVVGALNPALTTLVPPLLRALGVDLGIADISVPTATCQSARASGLVQ